MLNTIEHARKTVADHIRIAPDSFFFLMPDARELVKENGANGYAVYLFCAAAREATSE